MKVVPLRARAKCQVCDSKLPPRTEAYYDEDTRTAVCLTCARLTGLEATVAAQQVEPEAPAVPTPPPDAVSPVAPAPAPVADETPPAAPGPEPATSVPGVDPVPAELPEPLPFVAPEARPTRVVRPPLVASRDVSEAVDRPTDQPAAATRPPLFADRQPRPPLTPQVDGRPPLPPRAPIAPVLPPRTPVAAPVGDDVPAETDGRPAEERHHPDVVAVEPEAEPVDGSSGAAEPDVDDDPQWAEPSEPLPFEDSGDHSRHVRASAGLISRLRTVDREHGIDPAMLVDGDVMVEDLPVGHGLERGNPGDARVGRLLEGARVHGIEVLHHLPVAVGEVVDHLVVAVNGLWVIRAEDALSGPLERRDLGDWFTADPRLFVGDQDRSDLITDARNRAGTLRRSLASTAFADIPVRPVVCFGSAPAGWVNDPFTLAGVAVTWGSLLVEPLLHPVLVDKVTRARLMQMLIDAASLY